MTYRRSAPLTLRCSPPGGSLPHPAVACFAIGRNPGATSDAGQPGCIGPALAGRSTSPGRSEDEPIRRRYDMCAVPEARSWTDLGGTRLIGIVPARSVVTVPQVAPNYVAPAVAALHADGLRPVIPSVPPIHDADASDQRLRRRDQDPAAGARVPRGTLVVLRIDVSVNGGPGGLGPAGTVPDLTGIDVNRAMSLATSNGLRVTVRPPGAPGRIAPGFRPEHRARHTGPPGGHHRAHDRLSRPTARRPTRPACSPSRTARASTLPTAP